MSRPRVGPPRVLFESDGRTLSLDCSPVRCYDVSCDEQYLYMTRSRMPPSAPPVVAHINLITNWFEELKANVPAGGAGNQADRSVRALPTRTAERMSSAPVALPLSHQTFVF